MLSTTQLQLLFGKEWSEALSEYISGKDFYQLACKITELRKTKEIYPSRENVFRCFRETSYDKVRVVMVALDPYNNAPEFPDGLAFSNSMSKTISPSLRNILKEINDEYPENKELITHGKLDPQDLSRWSKQGVLLLNSALTVEKGKAGSHLELWKPFTEEVFKALNRRQDLVWILLGKEAMKFKELIINQTHSIITAAHPAIHSYGGTGFFGSNVFRKANKQLEARNKQIVIQDAYSSQA